MLITVKATCVAGPHLDGACIRYIDLDEDASLYDLHVAIQDAVSFDDEFEFAFYQAASINGKRTYIPDGVVPEDGVDTDIYEDITVSSALVTEGRKRLFYVFNLDEEWTFAVKREGKPHEPNPKEFYPLVLDELSMGPNPMQYGSEDDFIESEDAAVMREDARGRSRVQRDFSDDGEELIGGIDDDADPEDELGGMFGGAADDDDDGGALRPRRGRGRDDYGGDRDDYDGYDDEDEFDDPYGRGLYDDENDNGGNYDDYDGYGPGGDEWN